MFTLPQLLEEDIHAFDVALRDLLSKSESASALLIDKGGFLLTTQGDTGSFDTTTVAALAAASFAANQEIAHQVGESDFSSIYQQGENFSLLVNNVDEHCLLVILFPARTGVGAVKYYAATTVKRIAEQVNKAQQRSPEAGVDLSALNLADTSSLFPQRAAGG